MKLKRIGELRAEKETLQERVVDIEEEFKELMGPNINNPEAQTQDINIDLLEFLNSEIELRESELECPVCLDTAEDPIFQCAEGHIICSICCPTVPNCALQCPTVPYVNLSYPKLP